MKTYKFKRQYLIIVLIFDIYYIFAQNSPIDFFSQPELVVNLNSKYNENFISFGPDDKSMYLSRSYHPRNSENGNNLWELWTSRYDTAWQEPVPLFFPIKHVFITPLGFVGNELYFNTTYFDFGVYKGDVWRANVDNFNFQEVKKLQINYFSNKERWQTGCVSKDGKIIIFSLEGKFTYGVEDLYYSIKAANGSWSKPKNLGNVLNTKFQEISPFLAPDNTTLFFASNRKGKNYGGFDIYYSKRLDNTWLNWSEPENLGETINTKGSETSFIFTKNSDYAYFITSQSSNEYGDIYKIKIKADENILLTEEEKKELQRLRLESIFTDSIKNVMAILDRILNDTALIKGFQKSNLLDSSIFITKLETLVKKQQPVIQIIKKKYKKLFLVTDSKTNNPIKGKGNIQYLNTILFFETKIMVEIDTLVPLKVNVALKGYLPQQYNIEVNELVKSDTFYITLDELKVGNTVNLRNVLFERGTDIIEISSVNELIEVVKILKENPNMKILIKGHTEKAGNSTLNLELSEKRASKIKNYLIYKGISANRLSSKGFGDKFPLFEKGTEELLKKNRRVEFEILENN